MTEAATNRCAFSHRNGSSVVIIIRFQDPVSLGHGQNRAYIVRARAGAMAVRAGTGIIFGEVFVAAPGECGVTTNGVHAVRAVQGIQAIHGRAVAGTALDDCSRMALELHGSDVVIGIRIGIRPFSMR